MSEPNENVAARLCLAADAVIDALRELQPMFPEGVPFSPGMLRAMPTCPDCLLEFSPPELDQATGFLLRLGMLTRA